MEKNFDDSRKMIYLIILIRSTISTVILFISTSLGLKTETLFGVKMPTCVSTRKTFTWV